MRIPNFVGSKIFIAISKNIFNPDGVEPNKIFVSINIRFLTESDASDCRDTLG